MDGLCACGCGEPAVYAARHCATRLRERITEKDYRVIDCGFATPCWIWKGRRAPRYANVRVAGKQMSTHRAMYLQEVGPIPKHLVVDHLCEETRCLNPGHLALTTIGENVRRSVGFNPSPEALQEICSGRVSVRALAAKYGVSEGTISVTRRRQRQHVA